MQSSDATRADPRLTAWRWSNPTLRRPNNVEVSSPSRPRLQLTARAALLVTPPAAPARASAAFVQRDTRTLSCRSRSDFDATRRAFVHQGGGGSHANIDDRVGR